MRPKIRANKFHKKILKSILSINYVVKVTLIIISKYSQDYNIQVNKELLRSKGKKNRFSVLQGREDNLNQRLLNYIQFTNCCFNLTNIFF